VIQQIDINDIKKMKVEMTRFMMAYKFAIDEVNTKINILKDEFTYIHDYNPIEHVKSRLKSPESLMKKVAKKGIPYSLQSIKDQVRDIAGIRITVSFISDIYEIRNMLANQKDITIVESKDYIQSPKPNGYQSLHLILQIPIFMSDREENVYVEVQIRTIAMDFWASLEHKIYYKYNKDIPKHLLTELKDAATKAMMLDKKMEQLNKEVNVLKHLDKETNSDEMIVKIDQDQFPIPMQLLEALMKN